jgi:hypothetical protein
MHKSPLERGSGMGKIEFNWCLKTLLNIFLKKFILSVILILFMKLKKLIVFFLTSFKLVMTTFGFRKLLSTCPGKKHFLI